VPWGAALVYMVCSVTSGKRGRSRRGELLAVSTTRNLLRARLTAMVMTISRLREYPGAYKVTKAHDDDERAAAPPPFSGFELETKGYPRSIAETRLRRE